MPSATSAPQFARDAGVHPLDYLRARGFVQDLSDESALRAAFDDGPLTAYVGIDPTAPSLHVGHLLGVMALATLQRFGHRPLALAGGGTALVGDPTGKTATRAVLSEAAIRQNVDRIIPQIARLLDFEGGRWGDNPPAQLLDNADWLLDLGYIPFLRDIGRHFSVNEMLAVETYKQRLETTGLNFVEFNYRIVQAYDFLHLFRHEGCRLQMGGSDQWGNITAGVDLVRRADGGKAFALVWPLLTTAGGQKMGKTEGNSLWLDPTLTSPYDFFQYWINVADSDVARLLRLYTFLPEDQIADLTTVAGPALRAAKRVLAFEATTLTHGDEAAEQAATAAAARFPASASAHGVTADDLGPTTDIARSEAATSTLADLFVLTGLCTSRGDARRQAAQGGLSLDDQRLTDVDGPLPPGKASVLLRRGKKRSHRLRIVVDPSPTPDHP